MEECDSEAEREGRDMAGRGETQAGPLWLPLYFYSVPPAPKFTCPGLGLGNPWHILGVFLSNPPTQFGTDEQWSED